MKSSRSIRIKNKNSSEITAAVILISLSTLLFIGGLGIENNLVKIYGLLFGVLFVLTAKVYNSNIFYPKSFFIYLVFIGLAFLSTLWSQNVQASYEFLLLFIVGGLCWLTFFNLQKILIKNVPGYLVGLGFIFAFSYLVYVLKGSNWQLLHSLVTPYTNNHHHLGDYWVLVAIIFFHNYFKEKRSAILIATLLALVIVGFSLSRSAYIGFIAGVFYIFFKENKFKKYKYLVTFSIFLALGFFLFASIFKTTIYSRVYFLQGALGLINYPLGVGLGNFYTISTNAVTNPWGDKFFSMFAHNIFLEALIGIGVLGFVFVAWFIYAVRSLWRSKEGLLFQALFVVLSVNFFFDTTYFIPTMLWLWFIFLGLGQGDTRYSKES